MDVDSPFGNFQNMIEPTFHQQLKAFHPARPWMCYLSLAAVMIKSHKNGVSYLSSDAILRSILGWEHY